MKVPSLRLIAVEDLENPPAWARQIIGRMNTAIEKLEEPLQKRLSALDNFNSEIRRLTVRHGVTFQLKLNQFRGKPRSVRVEQVVLPRMTFASSLAWEIAPGSENLLNIAIKFDPSTAPEYLVALIVDGD